ncbi:MAG: serine hydrolase, partial [Ignavibacteriaceae bacterium]|nr:serine hydrolase [Ignavibacteriaceae bacterium]
MWKKIFFFLLIIIRNEISAQTIYFPPVNSNEWETVSPSSLGWCVSEIDSLFSFLQSNNTKAFIVLKHGRIAIEQYFNNFTQDSIWYWASAGKVLTATLAGIAQQEGLLNLSYSTSKYLGTGWTSCPPEKERLITLRHQLTMTAGLDDYVSDPYCTLPTCLLYKADAGTRWAYHNAPYTLLEEVIENATGLSYNQYFANKIKNRIGMNGLWVTSGYNNIYISNARSMARFGLLILNGGIWSTDTLLYDTTYFNQMINTSQNLNLSYGYLWWLNGKASYMVPGLQYVFPGSFAPAAPVDMIAGLGKNGQIVSISKSKGLVVIRMGDTPNTGEVPLTLCNSIWEKLNAVICNQTNVSQENNFPQRYELYQNFPNPFNPSTKISWQSPVGSHQTLKIYDMLGNEVAKLVDEFKEAGNYEVNFNAS